MIQHIPIDPFDDSTEFEVPIQDEARQIRLDAVRDTMDWFERYTAQLKAYLKNQGIPGQYLITLDCWSYSAGMFRTAGTDEKSEKFSSPENSLERLTEVLGKWSTKQRIGKCVNHFIDAMNLDPLPGQRDRKACANMAKARREQVQKTQPK